MMNTDSDMIWISMSAMSLIVAVLVLMLRPQAESVQGAAKFNPMAGLFRYRAWKYIVAGVLLCLSILSFALYKRWIE
jgi:hypothetical protein